MLSLVGRNFLAFHKSRVSQPCGQAAQATWSRPSGVAVCTSLPRSLSGDGRQRTEDRSVFRGPSSVLRVRASSSVG